jgi:hypothetical protein
MLLLLSSGPGAGLFYLFCLSEIKKEIDMRPFTRARSLAHKALGREDE